MKGRPSILSPDQLDDMAAMRERGWGIGRIVDHFATVGIVISGSSVAWHCKRLGADVPPRLRGRCFDLQATYRRSGRLVRPWTPEDDRTLLELEAAGASLCEIGRRLSRAPSSVRNRLFTLARRAARQESARP
ncbi:MAG: hypothetical protein DI606_04260 [Sphingobium sp.]|uniref:helix-turn-helix domain-containing protein n=1 Tax=Sphingobium sp. TaxID=1912891 RepID=UPI000DB40B8C|nr:helix-turn-helix domain-containing protein [Sphingobium sp.]PZU13788.1 MAG: hypothetical protein DI606_04260 [Sphingobium sp.]